jgi:hypothetical protein
LALIQETRHAQAGKAGATPSVEEVVSSTTRALAPVILPMIEMVAAFSHDLED